MSHSPEIHSQSREQPKPLERDLIKPITESLNSQQERKEELFADMLGKGIIIENESGYIALKELSSKYKSGVTLCENYTDITFQQKNPSSYQKNFPFTITQEKGSTRVYVYPYDANSDDNPAPVGYIENGEFHRDLGFSDKYFNHNNVKDDSHLEMKDIANFISPEKRKNEQEWVGKVSQKEVPQDDSYVIKKGDSLWKVVKQKYQGLQTNKDIIAAINAIVQVNSNIKRLRTDTTQPPDGILGDLIHAGDELILPATLTTKDKKEFHLKAPKK